FERVDSRSQQEMYPGQRSDYVDPAMQPAPARAAKPGYGAITRGGPQNREPDRCGSPEGQIGAQQDFKSYLTPVELLVERIEAEMQRREREGSKAQDAPRPQEERGRQEPPGTAGRDT